MYSSLPARGAWIEMPDGALIGDYRRESLPARGAWIEMLVAFLTELPCLRVAPRTGSVD